MYRYFLLLVCASIMVQGCGRSTKHPVTVEKPATKKTDDLTFDHMEMVFEASGLTVEDAAQSWLVWELTCLDKIYQGTKKAVVSEVSVAFVAPKKELSKTCILEVSGTIPENLRAYYITTDGALYKSGPFEAAAGYQSVSLTKAYNGPGAAGISSTEEAGDLDVSTTDGGKCPDFDLETFKCKT